MSNDKALQDAHVKIGTKQTTKMVEQGKLLKSMSQKIEIRD